MDIRSTLLILVPGLILNFGSNWDRLIFLGLFARKRQDEIQTFLAEQVDLATFLILTSIAAAVFVSIQAIGFLRGLQQYSLTPRSFPVPPLFFPCETKHVRMFPVKHDFKYSYLLTGVPVGYQGSVGGMISVDEKKQSLAWYQKLFKPWTSWFVVNSDDYLDRGHDLSGLSGKLLKFLENEGINPNRYTHTYLFTAARFINYASNPVSIWLLYSSAKDLSAIILEVNNTFGERHSYFLEPDFNAAGKAVKTWDKDFYVSVFNSRAGAYSLICSDPFSPNLSGIGQINTTITLSDASGKAMLIARLYSAGAALDPSNMNLCHKTKFILGWWWVGLATFPRTIVEAIGGLRRGLPWVFRPEPRKDTMSRQADDIETVVEQSFRAYLKYKFKQSGCGLRYIPAGLIGPPAKALEIEGSKKDSMKIELRILTPLFYSRLVQYTSISDALTSEITSGTITISPPNQHQNIPWTIDLTTPSQPQHIAHTPLSRKGINPFSVIRWRWWYRLLDKLLLALINTLRTPPTPIPLLADEKSTTTTTTTTTNALTPTFLSPSPLELDIFILTHSPRAQTREYTSKVLRLMLAERLAFGWMEILEMEWFVLKAGVVWWVFG